MEVRILGMQVIDFTNREGERIAGTKLHIAFREENVSGMAVDTVFLRKDSPIAIPDGLAPNVIAVMHFNRKGKLTGLQVTKPAKA
jgi:hypothetical protein